MLLDPSQRIPLESLPVFPLPNTVLYPEQQLPLHVFEPRYREMVIDALAQSPYIVIARIDGDPSREPAKLSRIATVGRIAAHQRLSDGRYNLLVEGTVRVSLAEIASGTLYRRVCCTALPEPDGDDAIGSGHERTALLSLVSLVMQAARARSPGLEFTPPTHLDGAKLAFRVADRLVSDGAWRQRILEADTVDARLSATTEALANVLGEITPTGGKFAS